LRMPGFRSPRHRAGHSEQSAVMEGVHRMSLRPD
jgi:hypothetical protein